MNLLRAKLHKDLSDKEILISQTSKLVANLKKDATLGERERESWKQEDEKEEERRRNQVMQVEADLQATLNKTHNPQAQYSYSSSPILPMNSQQQQQTNMLQPLMSNHGGDQMMMMNQQSPLSNNTHPI